MPQEPRYDGEIAGRTMALTTLLGYFVGMRFKWPTEVTTAAGILIGPLLDALIFTIKSKLSDK